MDINFEQEMVDREIIIEWLTKADDEVNVV